MDYMRTHYQNKSFTHCIYGLDADLIMLSLCSGISNIVLLREAVHFGKIDVDQFLYLDIQLLSEKLLCEIRENHTTNRLDFLSDSSLLFDYCIVMFLLGNDFIPHLDMISTDMYSIKMLLKSYKIIAHQVKSNLFQKRECMLNVSFLQKLFLYLGKYEDSKIEKKREYYYRKRLRVPDTVTTPEQEAIWKMNSFPMQIRNQQQDRLLGNPIWRSTYYSHYFGIPYDNKEEIKTICDEYWKSIVWTTHYYFHNGTPSWEWFYPYRRGPTIRDLNNYFMKTINTIQFDTHTCYPPYEQLLMVLPPRSKTLLPKSYLNEE